MGKKLNKNSIFSAIYIWRWKMETTTITQLKSKLLSSPINSICRDFKWCSNKTSLRVRTLFVKIKNKTIRTTESVMPTEEHYDAASNNVKSSFLLSNIAPERRSWSPRNLLVLVLVLVLPVSHGSVCNNSSDTNGVVRFVWWVLRGVELYREGNPGFSLSWVWKTAFIWGFKHQESWSTHWY